MELIACSFSDSIKLLGWATIRYFALQKNKVFCAAEELTSGTRKIIYRVSQTGSLFLLHFILISKMPPQLLLSIIEDPKEGKA